MTLKEARFPSQSDEDNRNTWIDRECLNRCDWRPPTRNYNDASGSEAINRPTAITERQIPEGFIPIDRDYYFPRLWLKAGISVHVACFHDGERRRFAIIDGSLELHQFFKKIPGTICDYDTVSNNRAAVRSYVDTAIGKNLLPQGVIADIRALTGDLRF